MKSIKYDLSELFKEGIKRGVDGFVESILKLLLVTYAVKVAFEILLSDSVFTINAFISGWITDIVELAQGNVWIAALAVGVIGFFASSGSYIRHVIRSKGLDPGIGLYFIAIGFFLFFFLDSYIYGIPSIFISAAPIVFGILFMGHQTRDSNS